MAAWVAKLASHGARRRLARSVAERWVAQHDPETIKQRETITAALEDARAALADLEDARYLRDEFVGPEAVKRWNRFHERLANRAGGLRTTSPTSQYPRPISRRCWTPSRSTRLGHWPTSRTAARCSASPWITSSCYPHGRREDAFTRTSGSSSPGHVSQPDQTTFMLHNGNNATPI